MRSTTTQTFFRSALDDIRELQMLLGNQEYDSLLVQTQAMIDRAHKNEDLPDAGIILHTGHTYLGLLRLIKGDVVNLRKELMNAIQIPKNGGIYAFGPNMLLCRYLIGKYSDFDTVRKYLQMSRPLTSLLFKMLYGRKWNKPLKKREMPDFKANLYYHIFLVDDDLESARSIVKKLDAGLL